MQRVNDIEKTMKNDTKSDIEKDTEDTEENVEQERCRERDAPPSGIDRHFVEQVGVNLQLDIIW